MPEPTPTIAVVIPVYNEESVIPELVGRLTAVFDSRPDCRWRAVLVDDGSKDRSVELIAAAAVKDTRWELIELSRNFGFQSALSAGLDHAKDADALVTMDADLQDPPELIPELVDAWLAGATVVKAVRRTRQETGVKRMGMDLFHSLYARLSDMPVDQNTGTFGLLGKEALDAFHQLPERNRFFPGLRAWIGFPSTNVYYDRQERVAGKPKQTLRRLVRYAFDGLFSFSYLPLRILTYLGLGISGVGFAIGLYFIIHRLLGLEAAFTGFTTTVSLITFLGGVQLIGIGVLGEYLGRIYDEVKHRPLYVVKKSPARRR